MPPMDSTVAGRSRVAPNAGGFQEWNVRSSACGGRVGRWPPSNRSLPSKACQAYNEDALAGAASQTRVNDAQRFDRYRPAHPRLQRSNAEQLGAPPRPLARRRFTATSDLPLRLRLARRLRQLQRLGRRVGRQDRRARAGSGARSRKDGSDLSFDRCDRHAPLVVEPAQRGCEDAKPSHHLRGREPRLDAGSARTDGARTDLPRAHAANRCRTARPRGLGLRQRVSPRAQP